MRIRGSPCARFTADDAIVGIVINSDDSVSMVIMMPKVCPAESLMINLTAVPSAAVSKLISLSIWMSVIATSSL
jgi:hypothetical protein